MLELPDEGLWLGIWLIIETLALDSKNRTTSRTRFSSSARAWVRVILAGKRDSRRHSTTSFSGNGNKLVSRRSWENFKTFFNKNNCANFYGERSTMTPSGVGFFENKRKKKSNLKPRPRPPLKVSIVVADIKNIDVEKSSLRNLGSGRRMLIMTLKKCVHVHLRGVRAPPPRPPKMTKVTSQLRYSLVMQPLLWKILDQPQHLLPAYSSITLKTSLNNLIPWFRRG